MKTKVTGSVAAAAAQIKKGNVVAFPTETVYGLGANALDAGAAKKIFVAKGRPADNPMIVHVGSKRQIALVASEITPAAKKVISRFFPGPVSVVLKKSARIPPEVTGGLGTVCVRMPSLGITRRFLEKCRVPVAAPSANPSGKPSPTSWRHVMHDMKGRIPLILKGPDSEFGLESTVIDCTARKPRLLRPGSLGVEEIEKVVGKILVSRRARKALSPGTKYAHYSPKARVVIAEGARRTSGNKKNSAYIGFDRADSFGLSARPKNEKEYARMLFAFFRECDFRGIKAIYCQRVPEKGMGRAIMDRLSRASRKKFRAQGKTFHASVK